MKGLNGFANVDFTGVPAALAIGKISLIHPVGCASIHELGLLAARRVSHLEVCLSQKPSRPGEHSPPSNERK